MFPTTEIEYRRVNLLRNNYERRFAIMFYAQLRAMFSAVSKAVTEGNYTDPPVSVIDDSKLKKTFAALYQTVGVQFARDTYGTIKAWSEEELVDKWAEYMREYAAVRAGNRIVSITKLTREQIHRIVGLIVEQSAAEGWGAEQTARALKRELINRGEMISKYRSMRIARTEVMTASNAGSLQGARDLGVPMDKIWIATMDNRTRDAHAFVNGQRVDINDKFDVGGALMDGPGDDAGGPENVINCRCTLGYKIRRDEGNNVI